MQLQIFFLVLILLASASGFTTKQMARFRSLLRVTKVEVGDSSSVADGKSIVVKTSAGEVIIANLKGKFYAVDAKCPHLGI